MLQFGGRHPGEIVDVPFAEVAHHRGAAGRRQHRRHPFAQPAQRHRRPRVAGIEDHRQFVANAFGEAGREAAGVDADHQTPRAVDGGRREIAASGLAGIVHQGSDGVGRAADGGIDGGIIGRGEDQEGSLDVGRLVAALEPAAAAGLRELGDAGRRGRAHHRHVGVGVEQTAQLALGDRAAAHDERPPPAQVQDDRIHPDIV